MRSLVAMTIIALIVGACNNTLGVKSSDSPSKAQGDDQGKNGDSVANHPVSVGGAFLACQEGTYTKDKGLSYQCSLGGVDLNEEERQEAALSAKFYLMADNLKQELTVYQYDEASMSWTIGIHMKALLPSDPVVMVEMTVQGQNMEITEQAKSDSSGVTLARYDNPLAFAVPLAFSDTCVQVLSLQEQENAANSGDTTINAGYLSGRVCPISGSERVLCRNSRGDLRISVLQPPVTQDPCQFQDLGKASFPRNLEEVEEINKMLEDIGDNINLIVGIKVIGGKPYIDEGG